MLRLLADGDVHGAVVRGLLRQRPSLDLLRVQDVGLRTAPDVEILEWTAAADRIVLSQDRATMKDFAYARVVQGQSMPGLFLLRRAAGIGEAIASVLLIDACSTHEEWRDQVVFIPL